MIFQVEKWPGQPVAYWSTCAYLINKAVMKPIVDEILKVSVSVSICVLVLALFFVVVSIDFNPTYFSLHLFLLLTAHV